MKQTDYDRILSACPDDLKPELTSILRPRLRTICKHISTSGMLRVFRFEPRNFPDDWPNFYTFARGLYSWNDKHGGYQFRGTGFSVDYEVKHDYCEFVKRETGIDLDPRDIWDD